MSADGPTTYPHSDFWRVQEVLIQGGLKLYEDGPPRVPPAVLEPRPARTILCLLAVLALAWLYGLSGFLPGRAGEVARLFLLSNPHNPSIGVAFAIPALAIPILLTLWHGRTAMATAGIVTLSYVLALTSEWALRLATHSWAALEEPPFELHFWSTHNFVTMLIIMTAATLVAASWRRAFLEPISPSERIGSEAQSA